MPRIPSLETKIKRGYGQGTAANYQSFISVNSFNSLGTCAVIRDWVTGRSVHCLSQGEMMAYYILRWDPDNVDIREQFPLWSDEYTNEPTSRIAMHLGVRAPQKIMTTDFLVTRPDGRLKAYSVKPNRDLDKRTLEKLCIEKVYWGLRGVPFEMIFKDDLNRTLVSNIRFVTEFYDPANINGVLDAVCHKIAIREWDFDMEHVMINEAVLERLLKDKEEVYGNR